MKTLMDWMSERRARAAAAGGWMRGAWRHRLRRSRSGHRGAYAPPGGPRFDGGLEPLEPRLLLSATLDEPAALGAGGGTSPDLTINEYQRVFSDMALLFDGLLEQLVNPSGGGSVSVLDLTGLPLVDQSLDELIDLPAIFTDLANALLNPITIEATGVPSTFVLSDDAAWVFNLNGVMTRELRLDATATADNTTIDDVVADLNVAIADAGLDGLLIADKNGDGELTFSTVESGLTPLLTMTTLRLVAGTATPAYGQLSSNVTFDLEIERTSLDPDTGLEVTNTETATITVLAAQTTDNATLDDLAEDILVSMLAEAVLSGIDELLQIEVLTDPGADENDVLDDMLVFAPTNAEITQLKIIGADAVALGFTNGQTATEANNTATSELMFEGRRAIAEPKFTDINGLMAIIEDELEALSDGPLPGGFTVDPVYDSGTDTMLFNIALNKSIEKTVMLDLSDGVDIGSVGTLELTAMAEATFTANVDLSMRVGIYLGALGADFTLSGATLLSDLNGGDGVMLHVGVTAANAAPALGRLTVGESFGVSLNGAAAVTVNVPASTTTTNFDAYDLAADINAALLVAGLDDQIEASADASGHINLLAIDPTAYSITVTGGEDLGFSGSQSGDRPDLTIVVGSNTYDVDLDGSTTVQDVIDAIETQTSNDVAVTIDTTEKALVLTATSDLTVSTPAAVNGVTSMAGFGLGILGANSSGVIVGTSLHGQTAGDRLFVVEPDAGEANLTVALAIEASGIDLRAALGELGVSVTDMMPLEVTATVPVRLTDPGVGVGADGRITLAEAASADLSDLVDTAYTAANLTADAAGTLQLDATLLDTVLGGSGLAKINISLATPNDLSSIQFEASTIDFDDLIDQLKHLSIEQLMSLLRDLLESIKDSDNIPLLNTNIPLLNRPLSDFITYADDLLAALEEFLYEVDLSALTTARAQVDTGVSNLPIPYEDKQEVIEAVDALNGVMNGDTARLPSRLIAAVNQLRKKIDDLIGTTGLTAIQQQLADAMAELEKLVPSMNTLADRLEAVVNAHLPGAVTFSLDIVDYDANTTGMQYAVVIGLTATESNLVSEQFEPQIPTTEFGPLELSGSTNFTLHAGGSIAIGFGLALAGGSAVPFVIVNDDGGLTKTELQLTAGFDGVFNGGVEFGSLEAVEVDADLSLLTAVREEGLTVTGSAVTLSSAPIDDEPRFVIVVDQDGDRIDPANFTISGTTLTITGGPIPTMVDVEYQTATTPGGTPGTNRSATEANRASVTINFDDPAYTITNNTIGAAPFADLFGSGPDVQIDAKGLLVGSLDVEVLNSVAEDAVTVAVSVNHLLQPQIVVDVDALQDMLANIEFNLLTIVEGIEAFLTLMEQGLTSDVLEKLPLIGGGLNTAGTFIGKLRDELVTPFREFLEDVGGTFEDVENAVRTYIFERLGPDGLDIIGDGDDPGTAITEADVHVDLETEFFEIGFRLFGEDKTLVDFKSGLGGLPIEAEGGVELGWSYDIEFGIGVDRFSGLYLMTNPEDGGADPEYELDLTVGLQVNNDGNDPIPTSLEIDLFGLKLSATDNLDGSDAGTKFEGMLSLDVIDPNTGDGVDRLPLSSIGSLGFGQVFTAELSAMATVDLRLEASINADLPSVRADLRAEWGFTVDTLGGVVNVDFDDPEVWIEDIGLDLGDFLSKYIGPAVETVDEFLEPIRPVLDLLTAEVPGVSEMSKLAGNGPVTLLDLAFIRNPSAGQAAKKFINVIDQISDVVAAINAASSAEEVFLNFGSLHFGGTENTVNLGVPGWNDEGNSTLDTVLNDAADDVDSAEDQVADAGANATGSALVSLTRQSDSNGLGGLGISLEFLKPINIFKYLIGQTADIVFWDIPRFDLVFDWGKKFRVIPVPPISVEVGFNLSAFIDLSVGYDTRGLQTGDFLDGFFFGDRENVTTGADIDEFGFGMGVSLAALLDILVASAGVEGEIRGDVVANWRDANNDGKLYLDEMFNTVKQDGILCLFDVSAEIRAIVRIVWEVLGKEGSKDIIDVILASFSSEGKCPKFEAAHVADGTAGDDNRNVLPHGEGTAGNGTLVIHAGAFAHLRQPGVSSDTHESYKVTQLAPGVYDVEGMGLEQRFSGVTSIFFDGGTGSDTLELIGVTIPVVAYGGEGADTIDGGSANDRLYGGDGADVINGFAGDDIIDGGSGGDTLTGGDGMDSITGGAGDDEISGGNHDDTLDGGAGEDTITGDDGADIISGGANNDTIDGGAGDDTIEGNAGADDIHGGENDDVISGGSGDDRLYGDGGNDELRGDSGHDLLDGGLGDDQLLAGTGNDLLIGDDGSDEAYGSWGNDVVIGHLIADVSGTDGDHLEGGPDDDFICGTHGLDTIFGGTSDLLGGFAHVMENTAGYISSGGYTLASCHDEPTYTPSPPASIHGQKFNDANANGLRDDDEIGLNGWTIELYDDAGDFVTSVVTMDMDLNNDDEIDPVTERGLYWIDDLDPGAYTVVEVLMSGWEQTYPVTGSYSVSLEDNGVVEQIDFGNVQYGSIHGTKWDDIDGDGVRDPDEPGLGGVTIYLDLNDNGVHDEGEPSTVTMEDDPDTPEDESGMYWLDGLLPGRYIVREVLPLGHTQTYPTPTVVYMEDFSAPAVGDEWSKQYHALTPNGQFFLGQFGDESVTLRVRDLPAHEHVTVEFDLYLINFWDGNQVTDLISGLTVGPDRWQVTPRLADSIIDTTFSNTTVFVEGQGFVDYPQSHPDGFGEGDHAPNTGALAVNTLGYQGDAVYRFKRTFAHTLPNLTLDFEKLGLGAIALESWGLDNVKVTIPGDGHIVDLEAGEIVEGKDFGNTPPRGDIHGQKFADLNGNGRRDQNETGIDGWTIELLDGEGHVVAVQQTMSMDVNHDGRIDPQREMGLFWFTGLEPGNYVVQEALVEGWTPTTPPVVEVVLEESGMVVVQFGNRPLPGSIHGMKWHDINGNGRQDGNEPGLPGFTIFIDENDNRKLDPGERSTVTMDGGMYWLQNVPAGTHAVVEVVPQFWLLTFPNPNIDGGAHFVELAQGQTVEGINFGNRRTPVLPGDFNNDTVVNAVDIDLLTDAIVHGGDAMVFDLTGDAAISNADKDLLIRGILKTEYGDLNLDRKVNITDLSILATNFGQPGGWAKGDVAGNDGVVNIRDLSQLAVRFGFDNSGGGGGAGRTADMYDEHGRLRWQANDDEAVIDVLAVTAAMRGSSTTAPTGGSASGQPSGATGEIHGTKWNDLNRDGHRDENEPGVAGVTIYIDLNDNGVLDPNEPSTLTMDDNPATPEDEAGMYWLMNVPFGVYVVREVVPDGSTPTYPTHRLMTHDFNNGTLYDIPPALGFTVLPRPTAFTLMGLSFSPNDGMLYAATTASAVGATVGTLNTMTGAYAPTPLLGVDPTEGDIDFDPITGQLYAVGGNGNQLYLINPATGQTTLIGPIPGVTDASAMAFNSTGDLYVLDTGKNSLLRVDKATANVLQTIVLSQPIRCAYAGMDFDPATGTLYVVTSPAFIVPGPPAGLWTLDVNTGVVTLINTHGRDLSGLEFVPDHAHVVVLSQGTIAVGVDFGNAMTTLLPDGSDIIHGHDDDDLIYGDNLVSDPSVISEGDADLIYGQGGSDTIYGQDKDDILWGADETIGFGGDGNDFIDGGDDTDEVRQTIDNHQTLTNTLLTGQGSDILVSIERATLTGGSSANTLDASAFTAGDVTLIGLEGDDVLRGGTGDDLLLGGDHNDMLFGNDGDDLLDGGRDNDQMTGGNHDDTYRFAPANGESDTVTETPGVTGGVDTLDFASLGALDPVSVDLLSATIALHTARTVSTPDPTLFENAVGGEGGDTLLGNNADNQLTGNAGDDTLDGRAGDDTLAGNAGNDIHRGGDDDDLYLFHPVVGVESDTVEENAGATGGVDSISFQFIDDVNENIIVDLSNVTIASHTNRTVTTPDPTLFENARGGAGNDQFTDNNNDNRFRGGPGDDIYRFINPSAAQSDLINEQPGEGIDTIDFSLVTAAVTIDMTVTGVVATHTNRSLSAQGPNLENAVGGSNSDMITGNNAANILTGGPGHDILIGKDGDDTLLGGAGNDQLEGGNHDDRYVFAPAIGVEADQIIEMAGALGGVDTVDFSALPPVNPLNLILDPSAINVAVHFGRTVTSPDASLLENAIGGAGNDNLVGNAGDNVLNGGPGNDTLDGQTGNDTLIGDLGNDDYHFFAATAGPEQDTVIEHPGGGTDRLLFNALTAASPVTVDLTADTLIASHNNRMISTLSGLAVNFENVTGSSGADVITGSAAANVLVGGPGADMISGGLGNDTLIGGNGANILDGGGGDDTYIVNPADTGSHTLVENAGVVVMGLASGGGIDTISFAAFASPVTFNLSLTTQVVASVTINLHDSLGPNVAHFENVIGSASAANTLTGNASNNRLVGGSAIDNLSGGDGNDTLVGRGNDDILTGGLGDDILLGGNGDDQLTDSDGRNILIGDAGDDILTGGAGQDILIAGPVTYSAAENFSALNILMAEWAHATRTYAQRIANLLTGVGVGGAFSLIVGTIVLDDPHIDSLTGNGELDWFLRNTLDDVIADLAGGETDTPI